ncbi:glycosyltransferase [Cellulomonas citrea]|uniref:glycosyltransferase n=1 Tax=Cellulomonas citrea TaxID=1909423 RepID=UPI0013567F97|nr:glycosyltransferase [Cellulomonas citrea]
MTADAPTTRPGQVSVILVNYRGAEDTITALRSLGELDWPADRLELIVVDNDSGDGSAERIRRAVPEVRVIESGQNLGFAGGCNLGVSQAAGEYVAFLNNDARPDARWVRAAVEELEHAPDVAAVASKVLDWDGGLVDYVDGSLTWFGMGYKREVERPDSPTYDTPKDVLFGTGAAMFVRADVYREVGGFDERFFMFYEDVDLGWRLNLLGHRVRYIPDSVAFHKHHVTMRKFGNFRESYLLERNALLSMYKNYDDDTLARALPAAMALSVRRSVARTGLDATMLDLQRSPGGDETADVVVPKMALTGPLAIDYLVEQLPSLHETRRDLQARRRRSDRALFPLFRDALEPAYGEPAYLAAHESLVAAFDIAEHFTTRLRVLVVTGEPLADRMAGPAIRAWEIAKALASDHDVRLVSTAGARRAGEGFAVEYAAGTGLREPTAWADVIIFQGFLLDTAPWVRESDAIVVADIYDPMHLEQLEQAKDLGVVGRLNAVQITTDSLNLQLRRADFLVCASEKQRDFWLGQLAGQGRVSPAMYDEDPGLRNLIDVVPFGITDAPPQQRRHGIKGTVPGIGADDKVILWGGGVYNWFDPLTLIRAVDILRRDHPEVRLFFMGLRHPNPGVPEMQMAGDTRDLAERLGLSGSHVFFNEDWVPYEERADYLLDADVGVSTHFEHIETAFSFRTRILDYLWAGLPVVASDGDTFADLIREHGFGRVVPTQDAVALAAALDEVLFDPSVAEACRQASAALAPQFRWSRVLAPLVSFCADPRRATDLAVSAPTTPAARRRSSRPRWSPRQDLALARGYLRAGGARELGRRAAGRARRVFGGS